MKAYVTEIDETKNYVVITTYNSSKVKQADLKVPKYFMGKARGVKEGDEVVFTVMKKRVK